MSRGFGKRWIALMLLTGTGWGATSALAADEKKEAPDDQPIRALLVAGGCCHDYAKQKDLLTKGISARANVEWVIAYDPDRGTTHLNPVYNNKEWYKDFDVIVHDECTADVKDLDVINNTILKPHKDGLPGVVLHCGMHCYRSEGWPKVVTPWFEFTGLQTTGHGAQLPISIAFIDKENPITQTSKDWTTINEELYNNIAGKTLDTAHPLARGKQTRKEKDGKEVADETIVAWTNIYNNKAKVFATTLGHNNETVNDPRYLDLVTRGLLWSVGKLDEKHLKPAAKVLIQPEANPSAPKADAKGMVPFDLARGKTATASSSQEGHAPADALDGNPDTRWCSDGGSVPQWFQVDLGKAEEVTGARINWEKDGTVYWYKIEGSADGKSWTLLTDQSKSQVKTQIREETFACCGGAAPGAFRYVRMTINGTGPDAWPSFFDFEIHGKRMVPASAQAASPAARADRLLSGIKAPPGFDLTLFAAPPDVGYPTCVAAAPTGEVFVGIDEMGSLGKEPGRGRVVRLIDSDGDGRADKVNVFAKMDHPRGVAWDGSKHTLYVLHPPFLTAYHDEDGDGAADRQEVLVSGIANEKAQADRGADHTTNGIRLGIDGWIYIAMGDFGAIKATAKDGAAVQFRGGGVVRVRTDGTGLECYSRGQRNIYDVAIDPLMNVYTRDNTNDGDGWNDRLTYIVPTADYGYPTLFKHFQGDFIDTMVDFGGGSPCGSLFVDEPGLPEGFGHSLYTVEWGRSTVDRHPLAASGSGFRVLSTEKLVDVPRGTDMDVDGQSRFYITSWANGGFSYSGPNVGYLMRLAPTGSTLPAFPDLPKASDEQLLKHMESLSAVCRQATQLEILHRGDKPVFAAGLEKLAASAAPLPVRSAAIFTLKQLRHAQADAALANLAKSEEVRELALRALADKFGDSSVPAAPFVDALNDANPRVRLVAAWGLGRLGQKEVANAILPLVGDSDQLVAHIAVKALVALNASEAVLKAMDSISPAALPGTLQVLQSIHEPAVVDGLTARLAKTQDPAVRGAILRALCRLCYTEAEWDGSWWGTRPDTTGPYYKPTDWAGTPKVKAALQAALANEKPAVISGFVLDLQKHRIELPGMTETLVKAASVDPAFNGVLLDLLDSRKALSADDVALVRTIAGSEKETAAIRSKAIRLLAKDPHNGAALDAAVAALAPTVTAGEKADPALWAAVEEFSRENNFAQNLGYFTKLSQADASASRELGYAVMVNLAGSKLIKADVRAAASEAIRSAWKSPAGSASLLRAVGRTKAQGYNDAVLAHSTDATPDVAAAAAFASGRLGLTKMTSGAGAPRDLIETIGFDKTTAAVQKQKGDPKLGQELFTRQGCIACHTVSASEMPKGPFLGGISARYNRAELCESIMKPSAKIAQGFETQWFQTQEGDVVEGFVTREAGDAVDVRNAAGVTATLKLKDVAKRGKRDISVMPEGLVAKLTPEELASLIAYLESLKGT